MSKLSGNIKFAALFFALFIAACQKPPVQPEITITGPTALKDVPSVRLNYRYEADVPAPEDKTNGLLQERNTAVQTDFDQNRPQELLDKTLASPDGKSVLAIYHRPADMPAEFRLDMYSSDGRDLRRITADTMAVHFPDTIVWSPDSSTLAFVAMLRADQTETADVPPDLSEADANNTAAATETPAAPAAPDNVLTFRTEQIYLCNADGGSLRPVTQNEGLIYFYYVWAADSSMLASLAATSREWQYLSALADRNGETFVPVGRPRIVEKNGRERRLDDALTAVQPVWSPDSAKAAVAFGSQVRIYDAGGNIPTQAAIPLRNNLLISSQAYDRDLARKIEAANTPDANLQTNSNQSAPSAALPDEKTLVSYNPVVALVWPSDSELYFQTAYIKRMKKEADSVTSYQRWHRLILTTQALTLK